MTLSKKVGFFYPSTQIGGAEILIKRYFTFLYEKGVDVFLITESEDEIYFSMIENKEQIIRADNFIKKYDIEKWTIIIPIPICFQKKVSDYFKGACLIAWLLHPGLLVGQIDKRILLRHITRFRIKSLIKELNQKKSIWFLDNSCFIETKIGFGLNILPVFMPLMLDKDKFPLINSKKRDIISIAFVQRAVKSKLIHAQLLLDDLFKKHLEIMKKVEVHFIGDGVEEIILNKYEEYFRGVYFHSTMANEFLKEFINKNIDITISMGQTALDAAFSGNVSIITDLVTGEFSEEQFKFNYIYENENFSLGQFYSKKSYRLKKNNIETLVKLIEDSSLLTQEKKRAQDYALKTYSVTKAKFENLIFLIESAKYRLV